jgi:hypothetical protein
MLRFWLERGGDRTKHCWKMKRRRQDETLSEDEAELTSSSWLHEK